MSPSLCRALQGAPYPIALSAHGEVRAALLDLHQRVLIQLADQPTHVHEILLGVPEKAPA